MTMSKNADVTRTGFSEYQDHSNTSSITNHKTPKNQAVSKKSNFLPLLITLLPTPMMRAPLSRWDLVRCSHPPMHSLRGKKITPQTPPSPHYPMTPFRLIPSPFAHSHHCQHTPPANPSLHLHHPH
ncbi:hypothetical protein KY290_011284 [Solanum tuberosum]|uniref:Uncharacterized protein n=1 Tax=Solanum tuberosum TaxID=4113 RepID=A0ABQ7W066_SOLTU|nr:hypothetical protein KY290_011284 [Solanum tuberosum]